MEACAAAAVADSARSARLTKERAEASAKEKTSAMGTSDAFEGVTVGQLIAPGEVGCKLLPHYALGDLASALCASGRTAAAVTDEDGTLVGLLTENDVMRAYWEGSSPDERLSAWLEGGFARVPGAALERLTVRPDAPLAEVAERMVSNAVAGDCACHHVVVQEEGGALYGVLSAHDMVRALCLPDLWSTTSSALAASSAEKSASADAEPAPKEACAVNAASTQVVDVMKAREDVITCPPESSMRDVVKVLLMTQQNSALIVDEEGIYGIVTPRDAVRAFVDCVPSAVHMIDWLQEHQGGPKSRVINADARLMDAAAAMTDRDVSHLVVVRPGSREAIGSVSALDLALCSTVNKPLLRALPATGPTVGELLRHRCRTPCCQAGTTLAQAAATLVASNATSATLELMKPELHADADADAARATTSLLSSDASGTQTLLTENDIVRAFVDEYPRDAPVEDWLRAQDRRPELPAHLFVPPSVPLTDAATLMLSAAQPGRACHHLIVRGADGAWLGVFSALDVARSLSCLCSELDVAKTGADRTPVSVLMRSLDAVPKCKANDSLRDVLKALLVHGQNAALVVDEQGTPCLDGVITPRCAMQALAEALPPTSSIASWLRNRRSGEGPREVEPGMKLLDAASMMASHGLHNLVVAERPYLTIPLGVFSSLDLVRGVASVNLTSPFVSLAWLKLCQGSTACAMQGGA
eukprot:TRINITY_DN16949_c0_g1_i2.p1 TRINITY_DN16949_c0_g1~~TRINITY_DN16949_c0_g1_i2.p1  ORF type:complete len:731 (-),score=159.83 TRINITY_DN16949_c0_g1_i2:77-2179(-)